MSTKNIYLVGFMGAGKSHIGRQLAKKLRLKHQDLDYLVEKKFMLPAKDIFKTHGESMFRSVERDILLSTPPQDVISTGGGVIFMKSNREFLLDKFVVWLNPSWEILYERIRKSNRPIVLKSDESTLHKIYSDRIKYYQEVSNIEIKENDPKLIIKLIIKEINN